MLFYHQGTNRLMINSYMKNFPWPKGRKPQKEFREMTKFVFLRVSLPRAAPGLGGGDSSYFKPTRKKHPYHWRLCIFIKLVKKNRLFLTVNVFSTKVVLEDTIFNCATGDGSAILRGHQDHAKVSSFCRARFWSLQVHKSSSLFW